jgi:hypothetical protein
VAGPATSLLGIHYNIIIDQASDELWVVHLSAGDG